MHSRSPTRALINPVATAQYGKVHHVRQAGEFTVKLTLSSSHNDSPSLSARRAPTADWRLNPTTVWLWHSWPSPDSESSGPGRNKHNGATMSAHSQTFEGSTRQPCSDDSDRECGSNS